MNIKRGIVVNHSGALEWGVGKVLEVTELRATIQFSDGITRKISSSHYTILQPADAALFVSAEGTAAVAKVRAPAKRTKKVKEPAVAIAA
jgi:hypothetical protein